MDRSIIVRSAMQEDGRVIPFATSLSIADRQI
jgi:hypothetical protein